MVQILLDTQGASERKDWGDAMLRVSYAALAPALPDGPGATEIASIVADKQGLGVGCARTEGEANDNT